MLLEPFAPIFSVYSVILYSIQNAHNSIHTKCTEALLSISAPARYWENTTQYFDFDPENMRPCEQKQRSRSLSIRIPNLDQEYAFKGIETRYCWSRLVSKFRLLFARRISGANAAQSWCCVSRKRSVTCNYGKWTLGHCWYCATDETNRGNILKKKRLDSI